MDFVGLNAQFEPSLDSGSPGGDDTLIRGLDSAVSAGDPLPWTLQIQCLRGLNKLRIDAQPTGLSEL